MEIQLKELIEKIKTDGVSEAESQAEKIINVAKQKADETIDNARKEALEIIAKAVKEKEQFEHAGKMALKQAGRDLILRIKVSLTAIFDSVVKREVGKTLTDTMLSEIILLLLREWVGKSTDRIDILLSKESAQKLEQILLNKLSDELRKGITIKAHPGVKSGFRISEKNGDAYYDFTDEGIAESLMQHLNPVLSKIIKKAIVNNKAAVINKNAVTNKVAVINKDDVE
jgi:V/A-type H+/Na+-transporting ATPase subunit E